MSQLRDFLYLDTVKLYSFVSQIQGGLINEINEIIKKQSGLSAGVEITIPTIGGPKFGVSKDKGNEFQQTKQITDPAYFNILYQHLIDRAEIRELILNNIKELEALSEGSFVEIKGSAEPPAVEYWIDRVKALVNFIDKNLKLFTLMQTRGQQRGTQALSQKQMSLFKDIVNFLEDYILISQKEPGKQYVRLTDGNTAYNVWCGLIPNFTTISLRATLPANVNVFGRVERLLKEGETYKFVDFTQFDQSADISKFIEGLNALGPIIGQKQISKTDLQAQYPDIFVAPVAIYK